MTRALRLPAGHAAVKTSPSLMATASARMTMMASEGETRAD
jgi:hypothetical protein